MMKSTPFFYLLFVFQIALTIHAQCPLPNQVEYLHVNNIRAGILNRGDAFWDLQDAKFQVPYQGIETPSTIFTTNLWFGGIDDAQNLRVSASTYRQDCGYIPGPVNLEILNEGMVHAQNWNKIFMVRGEEIMAHIADFEDNGQIDSPIPAVFGWPAIGNEFFEQYHGFEMTDNNPSGYADFYDFNGNSFYDPDNGDYPIINYKGLNEPQSTPGAIFWSVYHTWNSLDSISQSSEDLHLEIQQTSWAMACEDELLDNTIFTKYKITNFQNFTIHDFKFGLWMDPDMGCHTDDYVGCSPELNTLYSYNMDNYDDMDCAGGVNGYGENPPVQTVTFLGDSGLDGFMYYHNRGIGEFPIAATDPSNATEFYNYLSCKWLDGTPLTQGGIGYNLGSSDTTRFAYPDIPTDANGWSMVTTSNPAGDYRFVGIGQSKPGFTLLPGAVFEFELAFTFFRQEGLNHLEQVSNALSQIPVLQDLYVQGLSGCKPESCDCHCVWPGDTDNNGIINYKDAINIFKNLDNTGPKREGPVAWIGKESEDWDNSAPGGINTKYADANGDGIIDSVDREIVLGLFGQKNDCFESLEVDCPEGNELSWNIKNSIDTVFGNFPFLILELILTDENDFWGLSYQVKYDPVLFREFKIENDLLWADSSIKNLRFENIEEDNGLIQFIAFNDKKSNKLLKENSRNKTLELNLHVLDVPESYPLPYAEIVVCDAEIFYKDGSKKALPAQHLRFKMPDDVIISNTQELPDNKFVIYPNPTSGKLSIDWQEQNSSHIEILDQKGQILKSEWLFPGVNTIDLVDVLPGIYILRTISKVTVENFKIIIQ